MTDLKALAADYRQETDRAVMAARKMARTLAEGIGECGEPTAASSLDNALHALDRPFLESLLFGALLGMAREMTGTILRSRVEARRETA